MSAATFILAINLFVAAIFATAFVLVAATSKSAIGSRWLAASFGLFGISAGLEFTQPHLPDAPEVDFAVFATFLVAIMASVVGLCRHYLLTLPLRSLLALTVVAIACYVALLGLPRGMLLRAVLYQLPYTLAEILGMVIIFRSRRRGLLDMALLTIFGLNAVQFVGKTLLAGSIGISDEPQNFLHGLYAAYSQTLEAFFLIATGLLLLLAMGRDVLAEVTARSETDKLSGLLNRRGFEERTERAIATAIRSNQACTMVVADLDHFKHINDSFGHEVGDRVIAAFARVLTAECPPQAVAGRLGGEEFAVFLPGRIATGRAFAESARTRFASLDLDGVVAHEPVTASFGVTEFQQGESLSDMLRRADAALYDAKRGGRNRVCTGHSLSVVGPAVDQDGSKVRRRGSRRP